MKDCMLDLETWGTVPGSALRSVGAVTFDFHSTGAEFYRNIDDASCAHEKLTFDENTVKWWADPERAEAAKIFAVAQYPLFPVIEDFHQFFVENECEYIWSHGSCFDIILWQEICRRLGIKVPWDHRKIMDTRTIFRTQNFNARSLSFVGTPHHALHDARHQANCIIRALNVPVPMAPR